MAKKKSPVGKVLLTSLAVVPEFFRMATKLVATIKWEIQQVGRKVSAMLILGILTMTLLTSTWVSLSALFCFYLISLNINLLTALFIVFLTNLLLLVFAGISILYVKKDLHL